jgi:hypothetical protein
VRLLETRVPAPETRPTGPPNPSVRALLDQAETGHRDKALEARADLVAEETKAPSARDAVRLNVLRSRVAYHERQAAEIGAVRRSIG